MRSARLENAAETARAYAALARTTALFRLRGRRAVARATRLAMTVEPSSRSEIAARQVDVWAPTRALQRASRLWPLPVRCLQSALVLQELLRRRGAGGRVRIGSRFDGERLVSHAWVEVAGLVLDPQRAWTDFEPLPPLGEPGLPDTAEPSEQAATPPRQP